jgi:hypothetical protein
VGVDSEWIDFRACFDKPARCDDGLILKCMNSWNQNRRFTRLYIDEESDLWLRADISGSTGNLKFLSEHVKEALRAFYSACMEYQNYLMSEAAQLRENLSENVDAATETFICEHKHTAEKCVICLESFQVGQKCVRLPCNHIFHREEILKYLHGHPHCPICRRHIWKPHSDDSNS